MRWLKVVSFSSHSSKAWSIRAMLASKVTGFTVICKKSQLWKHRYLPSCFSCLVRCPQKSEEEEKKTTPPGDLSSGTIIIVLAISSLWFSTQVYHIRDIQWINVHTRAAALAGIVKNEGPVIFLFLCWKLMKLRTWIRFSDAIPLISIPAGNQVAPKVVLPLPILFTFYS